MRRFLIPGGLAALTGVLAASGAGCIPTEPTGMMPITQSQQTQTTTTTPSADLPPAKKAAVVKTQIPIGESGAIGIGHDLIVFGIGYGDDFYIPAAGIDIPNYTPPEGVHYIRPSRADGETHSAVMIPGSDRLFGHDDFQVAGSRVVLVRSTNAVTIFNTQAETFFDIPASTITLDGQTVDLGRDSQMRSDGELIVTINEADDVADGRAIKVIDLSGAEPVVISLPNPPGAFGDDFDQAAVHAASRQVVGVDWLSGDLHVWRLDDPDAPPTSFQFGWSDDPASISPKTAIHFDGTHVMFLDDTRLPHRAVMLNVATGEVAHLADGPAREASDLALSAGRFLYFLDRERADAGDTVGSHRAVIGSTADLTQVTLANQLDRYRFRPGFLLDNGERCVSKGKLIGYGKTVCVTPGGGRTFLAGWGYPDTSFDYIQMSTGGAFTDFADPDGTSMTGALMGSDIACSSDLVVFRAIRQFDAGQCARREDLVLGFIRLDALD